MLCSYIYLLIGFGITCIIVLIVFRSHQPLKWSYHWLCSIRTGHIVVCSSFRLSLGSEVSVEYN